MYNVPACYCSIPHSSPWKVQVSVEAWDYDRLHSAFKYICVKFLTIAVDSHFLPPSSEETMEQELPCTQRCSVQSLASEPSISITDSTEDSKQSIVCSFLASLPHTCYRNISIQIALRSYKMGFSGNADVLTLFLTVTTGVIGVVEL